MSKDNRWIPVLNGDIYCSPACGCKCTKEAHDRAWVLANDLVEKMGEGWTAEVWENGGWHYKVEKGVADIHPGSSEGYTLFFNVNPQIVIKGDDPIEILKEAVVSAREHAMNIIREYALHNDIFIEENEEELWQNEN